MAGGDSNAAARPPGVCSTQLSIMKTNLLLASLLLVAGRLALPAAEPAASTNAPTEMRPAAAPKWLTEPLSLADAINFALRQNSEILKAEQDLQATYGLVVQTRAVALPKIRFTGDYTATDAIETFPGLGIAIQNEQNWSANIRIIQSIYEGGRIPSALRAARLTREQALLQYQTIVSDTVLAVRLAYYDILLAAEQITVHEASVNLLEKELEDTNHRYNAGTVPKFNVLRAEVELANARPRLIRARNQYRIAKNNLSDLLGYNLPPTVWEDIPLNLTDKLAAEPYDISLPQALHEALRNRTELAALQKEVGLRKEAITQAKAGYKPSVQLYAGYGDRNSSFNPDLTRDVPGWQAGALLSWDFFDGLLTKGKVDQARALHEKAQVQWEQEGRRIELEVRTAYSSFLEARELLESQKKVQEQADEALRLAKSRSEAGTSTQLDVLSAQTALTEARSTQVQALHDYSAARARLERAVGIGAPPKAP